MRYEAGICLQNFIISDSVMSCYNPTLTSLQNFGLQMEQL